MGILAAGSRQLRIEELVLVKQEVTSMSVDLDMTWWADKQSDLFATREIQPWQSSVWIHTHPAGVNRPSQTDETTMRESFGSWDFAIMLILTREGHFHARLDFDHAFPWGETARYNVDCEVKVDWSNAEAVTEEDLKVWEKEFKERVTETTCLSTKSSVFTRMDLLPKPPFKFGPEEPFERKEEASYVDLCEQHRLDPDDPASYEALYGYWPGPGDFEFAGMDARFWE